MDDPALIEQLGRRARELAVARYDWNAITASMLPAYDDLGARP